MPVEQLEMAIPQGYGLFIKTIFQASSSREPSELQVWGPNRISGSVPISPPPCGQSLPHIWPSMAGGGDFPVSYIEIKPVSYQAT